MLKVEDTNHPATRMLGSNWPLAEGVLSVPARPFGDPAKPTENISQVVASTSCSRSAATRCTLLSLDTTKMDLTGLGPTSSCGDYPQAWSKNFGTGRVFYTALGHRDDISVERCDLSARTSTAASAGRRD